MAFNPTLIGFPFGTFVSMKELADIGCFKSRSAGPVRTDSAVKDIPISPCIVLGHAAMRAAILLMSNVRGERFPASAIRTQLGGRQAH
jgi:hypothetical protein